MNLFLNSEKVGMAINQPRFDRARTVTPVTAIEVTYRRGVMSCEESESRQVRRRQSRRK